MEGPKWCTIESDPGVFTELIAKFGVKNVQVEELWDMENSTFERLNEIYGLIFLFKYDQKIQKSVNANVLDETPEGLYFAKQTIHNACGTQAIINILLNCNEVVELGSTLSNFREFTLSFDPNLRGEELNNSKEIRDAHNSFHRPEPIQLELAKEEDEKEDAFHFIAYINKNDILYELDGLQKGPRLIGDIKDSKLWWKDARTVIQNRIKEYSSSELRFTLLGLCKNLKLQYTNELNEIKDNTDETSKLKIIELNQKIKEEDIKFNKWKRENIRRRHNYFPFIFNLLTQLAEKNKLSDMQNRAQEKKNEKIKKLKEKKEKEEKEKKEKENEKKENKENKEKKDEKPNEKSDEKPNEKPNESNKTEDTSNTSNTDNKDSKDNKDNKDSNNSNNTDSDVTMKDKN